MTKPNATATIALDRLPSSRIFDKDGHLHVEQVHITKAGVSPYLGREIPAWEELRLDPDRVYRLLRDPAELEKAAASLNNKPLLFGHNPVHADNHDHERTVGTVSKPAWNDPYLDGDMAVWSGPAIDCIRNDSAKELSSAYHYRAAMEPGSFKGEPFDGRMVGISFNHVGLVPKGRVGSDCVVADSAETVLHHLTAASDAAKQIVAAQDVVDELNGVAEPPPPAGMKRGAILMARTALSGAAAHTQGALSVYLKPKLAQDAKVDLGPLVSGITAKNFKAHKPALVLALHNAVKGKLAQDEDIKDVGELVDEISNAVVEAVAEQTGQEPADVAAAAAAAGEDPPAEDDDADMAAFKAMLKDLNLDDDAIEKVCAEVAKMAPAPVVEEPAPSAKIVGDGKGSKPAMDGKNVVTRVEAERMAKDAATKAVADAKKGMIDKPAMDAAIAAERQRGADLRDALDYVRPWVGTMAVACDSAEAVHRAAMTTLGIEHRGVDASALKTIIGFAPKPGDAPRASERSAALAQDAAAAGKQTYAEMFPNAGRLSA